MSAKTETFKGILLDCESETWENNESKSEIKIFARNKDEIKIFPDKKFKPYFYVLTNNAENAKKQLETIRFSNDSKIIEIEKVEKKNAENVLKLYFNSTTDLTTAREELKNQPFILERMEYDIPFAKRYLIDKKLEPMNGIEIEAIEIESQKENQENVKEFEIKSIKKIESETQYNFRMGAFDLETFAEGHFCDPKRDPIILISYVDDEEKIVFTTKKEMAHLPYAKLVKTEKEMIRGLREKILEKKLDIIITYNGDSFDFPYLKERARQFGIKLPFSSDGSTPMIKRKGKDNAAKLRGVQHLDAYRLVLLMAKLSVVTLVKYDLESVFETIFRQKKEKITPQQINEIWKTNIGLESLAAYNRDDSDAALKISKLYLPILVELCRTVKQTLYEINRSSASMLVEYLLINKCFEENYLIPNKPNEQMVKQRMLQTFEGGFVREPKPGLHENIAVLDFSSLHPTIMISHNISPDTLDCGHEECKKNMAPSNNYFCTKKEGFLSSVLKQLFEKRMQIKKELKNLDKGDKKYPLLNARQHALKILLNSHYGYLGYSRSRWYSRESARAVTAFSKHYVLDVGKKAEESGFEVIYGDTDSALIKIPQNKTHEDVEKFVESINKSLPGVMQLELENFYKRGIFVTKKSAEKAAKKRYALLDYNDNLKIVGFEYVRRDWSPIAKETQKKVIEAVLKEGKPEKAIEIVRKKIAELKSGTVPKSELTILTQIKRPLKSYESIGPHVAAAQKAVKRGKHLEVGDVIGFIITKNGKSISDRAELEEFVKEGNYDAEYYIQHQVVPAISKILGEFGLSEQDLIHGGKQKTLFGAF